MNQLIGQMFNAQPSQQAIHNEFIDALITGDQH